MSVLSQPRKLSSILERGNNNFDLIRLFAALIVIFGHAYKLHFANHEKDPLQQLTTFHASSTLGVFVFFFLSGMFITKSFVEKPLLKYFLIKRIARIFPGLIVCVFLTSFVIGPIVSNITYTEYFSNLTSFKYFFFTATLLNTHLRLPHVFDNNLFKGTVNGSLWTLPQELKCYLFVLILGVIGVFRRHKIALWLTAIISLGLLAFPYMLAAVSFKSNLFAFFAAGCLSYFARSFITISTEVFLATLLLLVGSYVFHAPHEFTKLLFYFVLIYTCLWFASEPSVQKIRFADFSYGIYIYGFLIQQIVANYLPQISPAQSLLISMPAAILAGGVSWYLVEKPFLKLANRAVNSKLRLSLVFLKNKKSKLSDEQLAR